LPWRKQELLHTMDENGNRKVRRLRFEAATLLLLVPGK